MSMGGEVIAKTLASSMPTLLALVKGQRGEVSRSRRRAAVPKQPGTMLAQIASRGTLPLRYNPLLRR